MKIGEPLHEHYIEPLELPEPLRPEPAIAPQEQPSPQPTEQPVR